MSTIYRILNRPAAGVGDIRPGVVLILLTVLVVGAAFAALYEWIDEEGVTHISDEPPVGKASRKFQEEEPDKIQPTGTTRDVEALHQKAKADLEAGRDGDALSVLKPLAEEGDPRAQNGLGLIYARGLAVPRDLSAAFRWHKLAADQGYTAGQFYVGLMYADGDGVAKDPAEGARWLEKAARQGFAPAQYSLGAMYAKGEGVARDYRQAANWYAKAAGQGHSRAQFSLGYMYAVGEGVEPDCRKAADLLRDAAAHGDRDAQASLDRVVSGKPRREGLAFSVGNGRWAVAKRAHHYEDGCYQIIEIVRSGETLRNWSELLTIQNFLRLGAGWTVADMFDEMKAVRERLCPGATWWNVVQRDQTSILYEWKSGPCAGWEQQHEVARIVDGNWNRFRVAFTVRTREWSARDRDRWIKSLADARVKPAP